mgnify:FL=1
MFIIEVVPAARIPLFNPQILTYFTIQKLSLGSLVSVPVNKKQILAVVLTTAPLKDQKMSLKKRALN